MEALIEKLEKICVDYNNQLSKYEALMYSTKNWISIQRPTVRRWIVFTCAWKIAWKV